MLGMAVLLIRNLRIVGDLADDVAVMYAGQTVEHGPVREVLQRPLHPFTQALIQSVPGLEAEVDRRTLLAWPSPPIAICVRKLPRRPQLPCNPKPRPP